MTKKIISITLSALILQSQFLTAAEIKLMETRANVMSAFHGVKPAEEKTVLTRAAIGTGRVLVGTVAAVAGAAAAAVSLNSMQRYPECNWRAPALFGLMFGGMGGFAGATTKELGGSSALATAIGSGIGLTVYGITAFVDRAHRGTVRTTAWHPLAVLSVLMFTTGGSAWIAAQTTKALTPNSK